MSDIAGVSAQQGMIKLFAAFDAEGSMRFIGEVARGAACGCRCPECGSPLVARLGEEREWHFAHEAGQERPECEAGALNMLRRLAVEHLRAQPRLELPRYKQRVSARSERTRYSEDVGWNAQFLVPPTWLALGAKSAPVGVGMLDNGIEAEVLVEIGAEAPKYLPSAPGARAAVAFCCSVPALSDLRKRASAEQHIARNGYFVWKHQPDVFGLVDAMLAKLRAHALSDDQNAERIRKREAEDAERRRMLARQPTLPFTDKGAEGATESRGARSATGAGEPNFDWAPRRKPNTSFIFYRFKDGPACVFYTMVDGSGAIAPWPRAEEGWDEALPERVGTADAELGVYRAKNLAAAMMFLGTRSVSVIASSDPSDFERK